MPRNSNILQAQTARRVLWIGAHPDDELFVAPFLGFLRQRGATIGFLVATRGEQGPCYRPEGCEPDLATVREAEMRAAAAVFGGEVWFAGCRDGSGGTPELVLEAWASDAGGEAPHPRSADPLPARGERVALGRVRGLDARFLSIIDAFAPDLLVSFDGHNGVPNHPDHIAAGRIAARLPRRAPLLLAESRLNWQPPLTVSPAVPEAVAFDARDWWDWLLRDLACHRSQMRPEALAMFAETPEEQRRVWLVQWGDE